MALKDILFGGTAAPATVKPYPGQITVRLTSEQNELAERVATEVIDHITGRETLGASTAQLVCQQGDASCKVWPRSHMSCEIRAHAALVYRIAYLIAAQAPDAIVTATGDPMDKSLDLCTVYIPA